jgi:uncharacterized membrane protein YhaH (DUF805 family)
MIGFVKNICTYLVIGSVLQGIGMALNSNFLSEFLTNNLIALLIALLAINITTLSVLVTKMNDLATSKGVQFPVTILEMRISINEQVALIASAVFVQILNGSASFKLLLPYSNFILPTLLAAILVYAIDILRDTAASVFVILRHEEQQAGSNQKAKII